MSRIEPQLCTITDLAALFAKNERTIRTWLQGLAPDQPGGAGRGHAAKWSIERVIHHKYRPIDPDGDPNERLDLEQQRARQAKETADKLELENRVTRGELIPPEVAAEESERFVRRLIAFMDSLPAAFVRLLPHLEANDHARIRRTLIHERNQFAADLAADYGEATSPAGEADHDDARSAA